MLFFKIINQLFKDGEFVYTKAMQGYILSAYFYGYSCSNVSFNRDY